jgi:Cell wall-associated hydrolases (invasion-associated proteins)
MKHICGKVLFLTAVIAVMLICILQTKHAYAASNSSKKEKAANNKVRVYRVASRGRVTNIGNADVSSVVSYAKIFLGTRYIYGASGPDSFDCSGFTMYVMARFGVNLPHSAHLQAALGIKVSKSNLRPGDLVFFATSRSRAITHVGLYIGNGNFIHASSGAGVIDIGNLNQGYYSRTYVTAVRVVT